MGDRKYEHDGRSLTITQWSKTPEVMALGLTRETISKRIHRDKWEFDRAVTTAPQADNKSHEKARITRELKLDVAKTIMDFHDKYGRAALMEAMIKEAEEGRVVKLYNQTIIPLLPKNDDEVGNTTINQTAFNVITSFTAEQLLKLVPLEVYGS